MVKHKETRLPQISSSPQAESLANSSPPPMLIWLLLKNFIWMDQALQDNRVERGGLKLTRAESQLMLMISIGTKRPIEVAKALGVSRQALNVTINLLKDRELVELKPDPDDKRCKIIDFADAGQATRDNAQEILIRLEREIVRRIGKKFVDNLYAGLGADWGGIPLFDAPGSIEKSGA